MTATDPPTVLIVDDHPDVRSLYRGFLEPGCAVREADTGRAALDRDAVDDLFRRLPGDGSSPDFGLEPPAGGLAWPSN